MDMKFQAAVHSHIFILLSNAWRSGPLVFVFFSMHSHNQNMLLLAGGK